MLQVQASNIFKSRNDWNVIAMQCNDHNSKGKSPYVVARIIENVTGFNPLHNVKRKFEGYVRARQIFAEILCRHSLLTYFEIGTWIGKNHSTICTSRAAVQNEIDTSDKFKETFDRINNKVKAL
jgi:chromosomal replication initiation ATPase DnaA